jgi:hypothetical protein
MKSIADVIFEMICDCIKKKGILIDWIMISELKLIMDSTPGFSLPDGLTTESVLLKLQERYQIKIIEDKIYVLSFKQKVQELCREIIVRNEQRVPQLTAMEIESRLSDFVSYE